jgi:hypothetical protein
VEIWFTHGSIAGALGQRDTAETYLQKAYADLVRQGNLIADEQMRQVFYNNIPLHRQILGVV